MGQSTLNGVRVDNLARTSERNQYIEVVTSMGPPTFLWVPTGCNDRSAPFPPSSLSMQCVVRHIQRRLPLITTFTEQVRPYSTFSLRPYQEACLAACFDALRAGSSRIGVSLPTGGGKTAVFISLLSKLGPPADRPDAKRSLVIVNSIELALQAAAQASKMRPDWTVEIEQGLEHRATGQADV